MNTAALRTFFDESASRDSVLGGFDCVRFVIEAIRIGWGKDFRRCLRYDCRRSAVNQLREDGGLRDAFSKVLGEPVARSELEPGDIAYFPDGFVGLVMTTYIAVKYRSTVYRVGFDSCAEGWKWDRHLDS